MLNTAAHIILKISTLLYYIAHAVPKQNEHTHHTPNHVNQESQETASHDPAPTSIYTKTPLHAKCHLDMNQHPHQLNLRIVKNEEILNPPYFLPPTKMTQINRPPSSLSLAKY